MREIDRDRRSILPERATSARLHFRCAFQFYLLSQWLAHMLDSLVRVTRRVLRVPETESSQTETRTVRDYTAAIHRRAAPTSAHGQDVDDDVVLRRAGRVV